MGHLGTVCNLLAAIGGMPSFRRANFPQPPKYYPPDIDFALQRLGRPSLARFIEFERPEAAPSLELLDIAPDPLAYTRVGDLYRQIRKAFEAIEEAKLFIDAGGPQDERNWSPSVEVRAVRSRADALAAIDSIIVQGEGTPAAPDDSHYERFLAIAEELRKAQLADPAFDPARNVATNPQTRKPRDAALGAIIDDPVTREVAELFNVLYGLAIRMLVQFFAFACETPAQRAQLRKASIRAMTSAIRPLGELLTRLPMGKAHPGLTAGPGFELYGEEGFSIKPRVAWDIFLERLELHGNQSRELAARVGEPFGSTLAQLSTLLLAIRADLKAVQPV